MASNVIDLLSSSPVVKNGTEIKPSSIEGVVDLPTSKWSRTNTMVTTNESMSDEIDEQELKRRRLTGRPDARRREPFYLPGRQPKASTPPLPLLMGQDGHLSKRRPVLEPIEISSSMEHKSPKPTESPTARKRSPPSLKHSEPGREDSIVERGDPFRSDPFVDSPPRPVSQRQAVTRRAASFDPFLSSSPPPKPAAQNRSTIATKPCRRGLSERPGQPPDQGSELDPFAEGPLSEKQTRPSVTDNLICIEDSSEISQRSSDDELPSIMDMDLTKRRPRSPIRRTQSDTTWSKGRTSRVVTHAPKPAAKAKKTAAEREADKENKRREREETKAARAVEKHRVAALAEVNKLRTDRKVSTPEMIVDLPSGLDAALQVQIGEMLQGLGVEHATWSCPDHNMIRWRRKVTSRFNEAMGLWEPIAPRVTHEDMALVILAAEEFVSLARLGGDALAQRVADVKRKHQQEQEQEQQLVFIIQGMNAWTRKNRSNRNRTFTAGVRQRGDGAAPSSTTSSSSSAAAAAAATTTTTTASRTRPPVEYISEDMVEDAMLSLQVEHGILVHHTAAPVETAKWVVSLTQHISTIPYKRQRDKATSAAGFCMETGQVRTGDGAHDTYVRMLQEIVRITAPIAYGIAAEFGSVTELVRGLEAGGPERLAGLRKSTNKDGAVSDRTVGQAASRRVHRVFTGADEDSTDV